MEGPCQAALLLQGVPTLWGCCSLGDRAGRVVRRGRAWEGGPRQQVLALGSRSNALSPSPVPFPSPHRKVPPSPTAQSPPPPLSFLQVVR